MIIIFIIEAQQSLLTDTKVEKWNYRRYYKQVNK